MKKLITLILAATFIFQACENNPEAQKSEPTQEIVSKSQSETPTQNQVKVNTPKYQLKTENLIFSFQTKNGKTASVCMDKDGEYIIYRFGTNKKIELEYPENKDKSSFEKFEYSGWVRHGGVQNEGINLQYLAFSVNGFKYIVYDTYFAVGDKSNVGVKVIDTKTQKATDIKGVYKTIKGTLSDLSVNNKIKKGDELYD